MWYGEWYDRINYFLWYLRFWWWYYDVNGYDYYWRYVYGKRMCEMVRYFWCVIWFCFCNWIVSWWLDCRCSELEMGILY